MTAITSRRSSTIRHEGNPTAIMRSMTETTKDALRTVARTGRDVGGRVTASSRVLPSLLISGGQRCGTTSMYKALIQQPQLFGPNWRKGVHYFDMEFHRGELWYRAHFPLQASLNRASARADAPALAFESSPYYLYHPLAAQRIALTLPEVRLLVLVRDPVERAYSAHAHESARGFEKLGFEEALDAEEERVAGAEEALLRDPRHQSHAHRHQAYVGRGEYARHLERISRHVDRSRIKVVDSHRFYSDPEPVYAEVLEWLGTRQVAPAVFSRHNARERSPLAPATRERLERYFAPLDEELESWLGRPPSWRSER